MQYGSLQGAGGHAANEQQWTPSRPIADTPRRPCLREVLSLAFGVFVVFMLSVFVKSWQHYGITSKAGLFWILITAAGGYIACRVIFYCRDKHARADAMAFKYQSVAAGEDGLQPIGDTSATVEDGEMVVTL